MLTYSNLKAHFIQQFTRIKLPEVYQLTLSSRFQLCDEDVFSYCTKLRILRARLLKEYLVNAQNEEVAGLKKKNKDMVMNQFKMSLRVI